MVIPVGSRGDQELEVITRHHGELRKSVPTLCRFVPLRGDQGWRDVPLAMEMSQRRIKNLALGFWQSRGLAKSNASRTSVPIPASRQGLE